MMFKLFLLTVTLAMPLKATNEECKSEKYEEHFEDVATLKKTIVALRKRKNQNWHLKAFLPQASHEFAGLLFSDLVVTGKLKLADPDKIIFPRMECSFCSSQLAQIQEEAS